MWRVCAGSVTGPHHARRGEPNQDAVAVRAGESWALLAVADGAGSLPRSGEGAARAVALAATVTGAALVATPELTEAALDGAVRAGVAAAIAALRDDPDAAELGATLALVVAGPLAWAAGLVGDSFVVVSTAAGDHRLVRPEPAGEYANITRLLTSADPRPLHTSAAEPAAMVAAASDGLAWATLHDDDPHPGFWTPLATQAAAGLDVAGLLEHMLGSEKLDDDTTLAVAVRERV